MKKNLSRHTRKIVPVVLMAAAFLFFVTRNPEAPAPETAEDVLISMIVALGDGEVDRYLDCFGRDLRKRLETIVEVQGEDKMAQWLKDRGKLVKGFAILDKEPKGDSGLLVKTETVYETKTSGQTFLLERSDNEIWKIVQSDFEMVQDWETDFGKPVWEVQ